MKGRPRGANAGSLPLDVRLEMRRVSWPTATHVQNTTIITLIAVVFFAIYLFLIDLGFTQLVHGLNWLLQKIAGFLGLA
jgi:preprotein translocase subunit SecE